MKRDKSLFSIVNISVKQPISERALATIIRSGLLKIKYCVQIYAFFTELPIKTILDFIKKHKLGGRQLLHYYNKNVKKYYCNPLLEEYFRYAK